MKANILHHLSALFLVVGMMLCSPAFAQHEGLSPSESQDPSHLDYGPGDDKSSPSDHETKAKIARDSTSTNIRPGIAGPKSKQENRSADGEDEDALSFNFLYYIIQKFKISDLIDE